MKRVIKKYRQLANAIDKDIKVKKTASEWYCVPLEKTIFIPQLETELGEQAFLNSINKQLPQEKKELLTMFPSWVWSFLHEIGHIQKNHIKGHNFIYKICCLLYDLKLVKIADLIYFNSKEEKQATQWAIDYIIQNEDFVFNSAVDIYKAYKKYYKKLKITIDN